MTRSNFTENLSFGIVAGAAGGLAEMAWVTLYAALTGTDPAMVAQGVTTAAGVTALLPTAPVTLGISVHMMLAVALGVGLAFAWRAVASRLHAFSNPLPFAMIALTGVWALNFLVVLPLVSPSFVDLLPYAVSFTSKMLFGVAAGGMLLWQSATEAKTRQPVLIHRK